jgi:16S rRNA (uracil1498-N3)-methyltransferase
MNLFLEPNCKEDFFELNQEEAKHLTKVLRKNIGDKVLVTNGKGQFYHCEIFSIASKTCILKVNKVEQSEKLRDYYLHLVVVPTKNIDRTEFLLEKITEIGVDEISLILSKNSERNKINFERVEKIVIAAVKQSLKAEIPKINNLLTFKQFMQINHEEEIKLIAHCEDDMDKKEIHSMISKNKNYIVMIGPEGDFNPDEIKAAKSKGFEAISLGKARLRAETAAIYVCNAIDVLNKI